MQAFGLVLFVACGAWCGVCGKRCKVVWPISTEGRRIQLCYFTLCRLLCRPRPAAAAAAASVVVASLIRDMLLSENLIGSKVVIAFSRLACVLNS